MIKELKTILYVEDDLHVRTTAKLVLEVLGKFEVRDCGSGREALHAARVRHHSKSVAPMQAGVPDQYSAAGWCSLHSVCSCPVRRSGITGFGITPMAPACT